MFLPTSAHKRCTANHAIRYVKGRAGKNNRAYKGVEPMNIVSGEQIAKSFQVGNDQHPVLMDVSVAINQGEFIAIMGPSGCGNRHYCMPLVGWTVLIMVRLPLMEWI